MTVVVAPVVGAPAVAPSKIMLAEADDDYRHSVAGFLIGRGYQVIEARDGAEALRLALKQKLSLAVVAFNLPSLNGYELIQELRSREETRTLPVIMLTGDEKRAELRSLGMDISDFIDKPIPNKELLTHVQRVLATRASAAPQAAVPLGAHSAGTKAKTPAAVEAELAAAELVEFDGVETGDDLQIEELSPDDNAEEIKALATGSPLIKHINNLLVRAFEMGASDVHFEPQETRVFVRVRINGSLQLLHWFPGVLAKPVAARLKIMSNLIITERRLPQDGRIQAKINGEKIEFRVSTIPSLYGEKIVLRILGGVKIKNALKDLGFRVRDLEVVAKALETPHGLLLVTGPTGSGKTTTLYTMLRLLNTPDINIMTAEDPVEYELAGATQVPANPRIGLTFESILRSFLRQDPDIMLVGEIRDVETAEIAVKASITGHLVLSTLHTNSAAASVMRLARMGVPNYLLADSVKLIIAQRLVKILCKLCRQAAAPPDDFVKLLTPKEADALKKTYTAAGCDACGRTGVSGRMPIFEVMEVRTPAMRTLITSGASVDAIVVQAVAEGMQMLRAAALDAAASGQTSAEEARYVLLSE